MVITYLSYPQFVHDDFPNPTTNPALTNDYNFYDYTDPNRSAEAELVHQCMLAWENSVPKGRLRDVLNVIFNSFSLNINFIAC